MMITHLIPPLKITAPTSLLSQQLYHIMCAKNAFPEVSVNEDIQGIQPEPAVSASPFAG